MFHLDGATEANMRVIQFVVLCCAVSVPVIQSQRRRPLNALRMRHVVAVRHSDTNRPLGPIRFHGVIGQLPQKYMPLSKDDEFSSYKLAAGLTDVIKSIPNVFVITQIETINLDLPEFWLSGKLYLHDITLIGVNRAQVQHLELRTRNNRLDFKFVAPHISVEVNFGVEGHLGVIPLYLSGKVSLAAQDLTPTGAISFIRTTEPGVGEVYKCVAADIYLDVQSIVIDITNGGEVDADMDTMKAEVLEEVKDEVASIVVDAILKEVNKELAKIPAQEMDSFLKQHSY